MNAGQLHRLARTLREIAIDATGNSGESPPSAGELAVVEDIAAHRGTSVTEVAQRTGLAQSMVSRIVAAMRDAGIVTTAPDPDDRRRLLITIPQKARARPLHTRAARRVEPALRRHLPGASDARVARATKLLAELERLLTPS